MNETVDEGTPALGSNKKLVYTVVGLSIALVVVLVLGAVLLLTGEESDSETRVSAESVVASCDQSSLLELSSDKTTIEYLFKPGTTTSEAVYNCLLEQTGAPASVDSRMQGTRALDGTQNATWDGWELYWSYDPDSGASMTLSEA
nr:hypothetical protein [Rhodococcus wratislaviensis]GLK33466.1 hypothetical protein GCM10017611_03080 [Rhodococcus wratislaviensis]